MLSISMPPLSSSNELQRQEPEDRVRRGWPSPASGSCINLGSPEQL